MFVAYKLSKNTEFITYEVQDGDTYASIAKNNNITISELVLLNDLDAYDLNTIYVGSILNIGIRSTTNGKLIKTNITTDDEIENVLYKASLQTVSVDTVTQTKLNEIKEQYRKTGRLDSITDELTFLASEKGYTKYEIKLLLNEYNIDLSGIKESLLDTTLENIVRKSSNVRASSTTYDDSDYSKDTILGLPFRYNTYSDPRRRVYNSTFMTDAPIVSIIPGKPLFRGDENAEDGLFGLISDIFGSSEDSDSIFNITEKNLLRTDDDILKWLKNSQQSAEKKGDLRYYRFKSDFENFKKYLDINLSTLAVKLGVGSLGSARFSDFINTADSDAFLGISQAFKFYCTKSGTSSNESISNEFGESQIAGTANNVSDAINEFNFLTGGAASNMTGNAGSKIGDAINEVVGSVAEIFGGKKQSLSHLGDSISAAASGNKLIWPQIWKNSTFSRSYNLSFEFVSPYGSPEAIFRYVYLPFITLLTMAMPKQFGTNGYTNPFLIRLEMPGSFTSDLAVIQNMSWRKGGNDNLFTNDGLPLAISVDISVQDLYPNMMMSESWAQLRHNSGMHSFLDNMAGLSVERFSPWENIKNSLLVKSVNTLGALERNTIGAFKSKLYSITTDNPLFGNSLN